LEDEDLMHTVTGLSGSGPAYVFYFLEALIHAGVQNGLDEKTARDLVLQTVLGAARLTKESGEDPKELRKKVSSPGGTTLEGIKTLEEGFFLKNIERTVDAATRRSRELALLF
jgi:pyrroline-5-carboxylate reductase